MYSTIWAQKFGYHGNILGSRPINIKGISGHLCAIYAEKLTSVNYFKIEQEKPWLLIKKQRTYTIFLSSYKNTSASMGEREMCGNTSRRWVFPQLLWVLPNFHECFYKSIETRSKCFLFLLENTARKRKTNC